MQDRHAYYTLVASLPALPHFAAAEVLPINAERLRERLRMLRPEDWDLVEGVDALISWHRVPVERSDRETVAVYERLAEIPRLKEIVELRANVRTLGVALRRKRMGMSVPSSRPHPWGAGPYVRHIQRHWDDPVFKLAPVFPWLPGLREKLEAGDSLGAERSFLNLLWTQLTRLAEDRPFELTAVITYLFKWDIVKRWLSYDEARAEARFGELSESADQKLAELLS